MPKITVLPRPELAPKSAGLNVPVGTSVCGALLNSGIEIEHAYDVNCACTTCHYITHKGFDSLNEIEECEDDPLDRAWGLEAQSHLSCQTIVANEDLTAEIPKYMINHAKKNH